MLADYEHSGYRDALLVLRGVSLRQVARTLHGLHSCVTAIEEQWDGETHILIYTFNVAGQHQSFTVPITAEPVESIADLYPETAVWEQELTDRAVIRLE